MPQSVRLARRSGDRIQKHGVASEREARSGLGPGMQLRFLNTGEIDWYGEVALFLHRNTAGIADGNGLLR